MKKYQKPKLKVEKVKINFFMSKLWWVDQFNFVGDVYAQYGDSGYGDGGDGGYDSGNVDAVGGGDSSSMM